MGTEIHTAGFSPVFLTVFLLVSSLSAPAAAQTSLEYFPHELGDRWTYAVQYEWADTVVNATTVDVVAAVNPEAGNTRVTVRRDDTVEIRYRLSGDTIFVGPETVGLDVVFDVLGIEDGADFIGDLGAFRLDEPLDQEWVISGARRRVAVPEDLREVIPADSVEVIIDLRGRRLPDAEISVPEGTYLARVFESRMKLSIRVRLGLFLVTFDLIDGLPLRSYLAPERGIVAQYSPAYDIVDPLNPTNVIFQIPAQEVEMTSFQRGTSADFGDEFPSRVYLHPSYPNPFNPVTSFRIALPEPMHAKVEVFDAAGRRVDVLAEGFFTAGTHDLHWDARSCASGTYLLRLVTPGQTLVRRMVLVR